MANAPETAELLEAIRDALRSLATLQQAVANELDPPHYLALSDAQQTLAQAYTRAGGQRIEGFCEMCGQELVAGERLCGDCERSYGPTDPDD